MKEAVGGPSGASAGNPEPSDPDESPERQLEALMRITEATILGPAKRIFVNRTLRCDQIRQVGFDMDEFSSKSRHLQATQLCR